MRRLFGEFLDDWQARYALTADRAGARSALATAASRDDPFTLAILDQRLLSEHDDPLDWLHGAPGSASARLIVLTGHGKRCNVERMHARGFTGYLSRPLNQHELYTTLHKVTGQLPADDRVIKPATRATPGYEARVLVVEDNATNQAVARGMLKKLGIDAQLVANGQEALLALERERYDLVFMDCQMPIMDGFEATQRIRDPGSPVQDHATRIVAMTANAQNGDREHCLSVGMDDYLAKPISSAGLREILDRWLPDASRRALPAAGSVARSGDGPAVFDAVEFDDRLLHDDDLKQDVTDTFLEEMPGEIARLKSLVTARDLPQSTVQAHKIKGAAANVSGRALSAHALAMEQAGKAGDLDSMRGALPELERRFAQLRERLTNRVQRGN